MTHPLNIDLIYVRYSDRGEMSCALTNPDNPADGKLLGPVPAKEAIKALGPLLAKELPDRFKSDQDATNHLVMVHFHNMSRQANSAGQDYPYQVR